MFKNRSFIILIAFVLLLLILPKQGANQLRNWTMNGIAPAWDFLNRNLTTSNKVSHLELENKLLRAKLQRLEKWVDADKTADHEFQEFKNLVLKKGDPFYERRCQYLAQILNRQLYSLPARVVFREPASWSSSVWINVGTRDNEKIGKEIVAENSPVVVGKSIVGVIEKVTPSRSLVRLITDPSLNPSVRAVRKGEQDRVVANQIEELCKSLSLREELIGSKKLRDALGLFAKQLHLEEKEWYLAKGQLHGASRPLWKTIGQKLNGSGFNYDFGDEEGMHCNLRTGIQKEGKNVPLIRVGDLLVTTGMDGIFPPDLHVAVVTKIAPLYEGGCSYNLEAETFDIDFNTLSEVFVLPPL